MLKFNKLFGHMLQNIWICAHGVWGESNKNRAWLTQAWRGAGGGVMKAGEVCASLLALSYAICHLKRNFRPSPPGAAIGQPLQQKPLWGPWQGVLMSHVNFKKCQCRMSLSVYFPCPLTNSRNANVWCHSIMWVNVSFAYAGLPHGDLSRRIKAFRPRK